jgi:nucleotidyltransferase substrate binding protein (TIGR01987 family)
MIFFETMRAGVIQNFEFTFELCRKFMRRWLENNPGLLGSDIITNKVIFRLSAQEKLIDNPVEWFRFQEARNISSHTYDEEKAEKVLKVAIEFLPSAKQFLSNLERAND